MTKKIIIKISILFLVMLAIAVLFIVLSPNYEVANDIKYYIPESSPTIAETESETFSDSATFSATPTVKIVNESYTFNANEWHYESPELTVHINKSEMYGCDVFIADIILSDMTQIKSGFARDRLPPTTSKNVDEIASIYNSVLAVNGDYFIKDSNKYNSPIIKNGEVVRKSIETDFLAVLPDRLEVYIANDEISFAMLQKMDAYNTYAFGPILILDEEIYPKVYLNRKKGQYPRCGVGEIEPNHLIVILVDSTENSNGISLAQFAKIFKEQGATLAYNMDAGSTPSMVFMGVPINFDTQRDYEYQRETSDIIYFGESENSPDTDEFEKQFKE